jgi:aminoglycoside phosphotransferase (APT) family kinase protein
MEPEQVVLDLVRSALVDEAGHLDPGDLVIVHEGRARRRSSLYFVGLAGSRPACRWVVKQPNSGIEQADLASPLSALSQFRALQRLHRHLLVYGGTVGTPRPVAYLPELDAYVMEYVPGPTVTSLITAGAILRPNTLLKAVSSSAEVLQAVHSIEPAVTDRIDLADLSGRAASRGRQLLEEAGLPTRDRWFEPGATTSAYATIARKVVLHGDFAPENVVCAPSGFYCLEPDLVERDWPEYDVARYVLMLFDAPLFVAGAYLPPLQNLRRRAGATFLDAYYRNGAWADALQPLMLLSLAARWSMRHTDLARRAPRLRRSRERLVRRHFERLLDEVSAPGWLEAGR